MDREVEYNCHLLNDVDPPTALAAVGDDERKPEPAPACAWCVLVGVLAAAATALYCLFG